MTQDGFVTATRCATEDEARAVAVRLVEHGIGATVERLPEPPKADDPGGRDLASPEEWPVSGPAQVPLVGDVDGPADAAASGGTDDPRPFAVRVLAGDGPRAEEILAEGSAEGDVGVGAANPATRSPAAGGGVGSGAAAEHAHRLHDDLDAEPVEKPPTPWKKILLIWAAAMVLLPLAAFVLTYLVLSR